MTGPETAGAQAVDRALEILWQFDERTPALTIAEVASALGVHRTTAGRLLSALVRARLLERAEDGRFGLGLGLVSLAGQVLGRLPVHAAAGDIVRDLRDASGEAVWLGVLDHDEVLYLHQAVSPRMRVAVDWVGRRQPLTDSVVGAVLLAYQPQQAIDGLLAEARADGRERGRIELPELAETRRVGHLARYHDAASGHAVVAAPVHGAHGETVAALALSAAPEHVDERRFAHELIPATRSAAARITERLAGAPLP